MDEARAEILDLVSDVKLKVQEGLFDARIEDRESLEHHPRTFDRDYLVIYRQPRARTHDYLAVSGVEDEACWR